MSRQKMMFVKQDALAFPLRIEKPPPLLSSLIDLNFVDGFAKIGKDRTIIVGRFLKSISFLW